MMEYAVTGHRSISEADWDTIQQTIQEIIRSDADTVYFGGADGTDSVALREADRARDGTDVSLVAVVPWTLEEQPNDAVAVTKAHADRVVELESDAPVGIGRGFFERNDELVDRADELIAFWSGKESGGTYNTLTSGREDPDTTVRVVELEGG
jgi:hypothetical protein